MRSIRSACRPTCACRRSSAASRWGSAGALVSFPVERVVSASIQLVDGVGKPVKVGSRVVHRESGQIALVGWNGETYFEGLAAANHLCVTKPDGTRCTQASTPT
nr:FimD/PapC C-terminal domain-containing protein [Burkholderia cepacia]